MKHVPVRMCCGCRKRRSQGEMIRFIKGQDGILFMDEKKRLKGRGFYVCPDDMCLKLAKKRIQIKGIHSIDGSVISFDLRFPQKDLV